MENYLKTLNSFAKDEFEHFVGYCNIIKDAIVDFESFQRMVEKEHPDLTVYPKDRVATKLIPG